MNTRTCTLALMLLNTTMLFAKSHGGLFGGNLVTTGLMVAIIAIPLAIALFNAGGDVANFFGAIIGGLGLLALVPAGLLLLSVLIGVVSSIMQLVAIAFVIIFVIAIIYGMFSSE